MKLLGWMHRKLRQNSIEPLKNFTIGNSCTCLAACPSFEGQRYYPEPSYSPAHLRQPKICEKSSIQLKANTVEEIFDEDSSIMISELFHGFLTIGTLGSERIITEPTTPKFAMSFENVTEKETEVTESELKLINDELEKFLEAEAKEVGNESSERSSHASVITLSSIQTESVNAEDYRNMVECPLQGYLFGYSIELPETGIEMKKEKTSLGELFKKNKLANKDYTGQSDKWEKQAKGKHEHAMQFMKKLLQKLHSSSRSCRTSVSGNVADSVSTKRRLTKVLRMFHRKIHPEKSTAEKNFPKSQKYEIKNTSYDCGHHNGEVTFQDNYNNRFPSAVVLKKEITNLSLSHNRLSSSHSTGNGEHWIKTDADYLVLEL